MCNLVCPDGCLCYGWALFYSAPFPAALFTELRYLDAHNTSISWADLTHNSLLIFLNFSWCGLRSLAGIERPYLNLLTIDLRHNQLTAVPASVLTSLPQLRELWLSGNPLAGLHFPDTSHRFSALQLLDASEVGLAQLDVQRLSEVFPNLRVLNLSHTGLSRLPVEGFQPLQQLRVVDLTGCPVSQFSDAMFHGLQKLEDVLADNFQLCCPVLRASTCTSVTRL
jgi:Leucine-rich repeat (LRR) protein